MANIMNGTPVVFGFPTTANGITITGLAGVLLESANVSRGSDIEVVRDAVGEEVTNTFYNQTDTATLETRVIGSTKADAITKNVKQNAGAILAITACAGNTELVGTNWQVVSCNQIQVNTSSAKISFSLKKCALITAVAT